MSGVDDMSTGRDDRLGGHSDAQAEGRTDTGPIRRYTDEDRGENPAEHFPHADAEVGRRLGGADTGSLRTQEQDEPESCADMKHPVWQGVGGDRPPIYEGATSTSGVGGLDAGMGSAGVSGGTGSPAGSPAIGATGGRSGTGPGVTSTTGAGYSSMTGTGRTGGPTRGSDDADRETAQPPRASDSQGDRI
jgi:hypothetical protein